MRAGRVCVALLGLAAAAILTSAPAAQASAPLGAFFSLRSYAPGQTARLVVRPAGASKVSVQLFRVGIGPRLGGAGLDATAVEAPQQLLRGAHGAFGVRLYGWPSGVYLARVRNGARTTFAPLVLRSVFPGESGIGIVVPTDSWAAYNFYGGDSWYVDPAVHTASQERPFATTGVPAHHLDYALGLLALEATQPVAVDYLSDDDLDRLGPAALAKRYRLLIFAGHEEYVTAHVFAAVTRFRDLGGNLALLSANDFFRHVVRGRGSVTLIGRFRDEGLPEAALLGAQYLDWNHGVYPNAAFAVQDAAAAPWLFAGTQLRAGSRFGRFGIEIDATTADSPAGTRVLATIPDVFGAGESAQMTLYGAPSGAEVFDAGAINFGMWAPYPPVRRMLLNLIAHLAAPRA